MQAIKLGKKKIYICLGGSSTNDGGAGASAALGAVFKNKSDENFVPTGGNLNEIESADLSELKKNICGVEFIGLCDVKNPLLGENGCSYVYAKQKGAKEETLKTLDGNMEYFTRIISRDNFVDFPGAGAAGGVGISHTRLSVVRTIAAMEAAFWSALRVTLVGSIMPLSSITQYSSLRAS